MNVFCVGTAHEGRPFPGPEGFPLFHYQEIMLRSIHQAVAQQAFEACPVQPFGLDGESVLALVPLGRIFFVTKLSNLHFFPVYGFLFPFSTVNTAEITVFIHFI